MSFKIYFEFWYCMIAVSLYPSLRAGRIAVEISALAGAALRGRKYCSGIVVPSSLLLDAALWEWTRRSSECCERCTVDNPISQSGLRFSFGVEEPLPLLSNEWMQKAKCTESAPVRVLAKNYRSSAVDWDPNRLAYPAIPTLCVPICWRPMAVSSTGAAATVPSCASVWRSWKRI